MLLAPCSCVLAVPLKEISVLGGVVGGHVLSLLGFCIWLSDL